MNVRETENKPKVGLEIHCQLDTQRKLFCSCPTQLSKGEPAKRFLRRLRPTQSELGEVDPAALFEFQKGRTIMYEADPESSCLVEADEEPPHPINGEAVDAALEIALLLKARPVDEVHVMRKVVIDGSNTTGFQRTAAIAIGGELELAGRRIPIEHVSLEEDAARKTGESGMTVYYRIDRLGIPLVEIATGPVIHTPMEAQEVALAIGRLLKATRKVKRGLGTIRQDLNISVPNGALVEIKGVQRLDLISKAVELEFKRQESLIEITEELKRRGIKGNDLRYNFVDLSEVFRETKSKVIRRGLEGGGVALAVKLPGFNGLLGRELIPGVRLGTEMAWRASFYGKVKGIFHTDELPGYGIAAEEVEAMRKALDLREGDAAVLICDAYEKAVDGLRAVVDRAREALTGVPEETRAASEDGSSRYMRPRPGVARMYPETDIPALPIEEERITRIRRQLPEMPEETVKRLMSTWGLNEKLALQLLDSDYLPLFEEVASTTKVPSSVIATVLTELIKSMDRRGVPVEDLDEDRLEELFKLVDEGVTAKESLEPILEALAKDPELKPAEAIEKLGLKMLSDEELTRKLKTLVEENLELIEKLEDKALGKIMSLAMREFRGRVDPGKAMSLIRRLIQELKPKPE
ncbi:MAG: Glu-tRNA(Gln) amidotransferase subunit GatE [Candidatus Bathyarchaeia archaeon]